MFLSPASVQASGIVLTWVALSSWGMEVAMPTQPRVVKFGVFEADLDVGELRKSGMRQKLAGQPFEALRLLLERPQEIVTREELQQHIWPKDTFVDYDLALRKAVARLREVLGDSADNPRFIETIPRRGYRFIAQLHANGDDGVVAKLPIEKGPAETLRPRRNLQIGIGSSFAILLSLVLTVAVISWAVIKGVRQQASAGSPAIRSLAVLPLKSLSVDPGQEYLSEGITDSLITELAQIKGMKVISRTSSMQYKDSKKSLREIARELKVDGIVEGTIQRSGDRVRITAQLIRGSSDEHLWANSYERDIRDVFMLEREVTGDIAHRVQAQLKIPNQASLAQARSVNAKALEAYLQGNYFLNRFTEEETRQAQEYFQQAIDADPTFAAAYVGMALAHYGPFQGEPEDAAIARRAAERALELDPTLSDAWVTLGKIKLASWDWPGMEEEFRKAIDINPNNASAHEELGKFLDAMGRLDEGLKECQIAQQFDPNRDHLSEALYYRREFDRSIEIELLMLRKDPDNVELHHSLYLNYEAKGMYEDAGQQLERAWALGGFPEVALNLHQAFAISGYRGAMRAYAKDLEHVHATKRIFLPVNLAGVYTILGDKDRAFYWLEQAYKHGPGPGIPLWGMKLYPALEPLHSDPRFKDLVQRIGLPP